MHIKYIKKGIVCVHECMHSRWAVCACAGCVSPGPLYLSAWWFLIIYVWYVNRYVGRVCRVQNSGVQGVYVQHVYMSEETLIRYKCIESMCR